MPDSKPKNPSCGVVLYARSEEKKHGVTQYSGCNKWSCAACAERKKRRLMARVIYGMQQAADKKWYFVTLTAPKHARNFGESLRLFRDGFRKVYKAMKHAKKAYELEGDFMFIKMFERHADGTLHLHMICDVNWQSRRRRKKDEQSKQKPYVFLQEYKVKRRRKEGGYYYRSSFLSDKCAESGLGYIGECRPIKARKEGEEGFIVAAYIAKYIAKQAGDAAAADEDKWPKGTHRVEFSSNWPKLPDMQGDGYDWIIARRGPIIRDKLAGFTIEDKAGFMGMIDNMMNID